MRSTRSRVRTTIVVGLLVAGCASASSPVPSTPNPSSGSSLDSAAALSADPSSRPSPTTADGGGTSSASPLLLPPPKPAGLPAHGSAREIGLQVWLAPGPDGTLFVSIPRAGGSVLALLDRAGKPRSGWPITVSGAPSCDLLLPVADGSVRVVCTLENPDGNMFDPVGAFAFDSSAHLVAGWPVVVEGFFVSGGMVGQDLALFTRRSLGDVPDGGPTTDGGLVSIAADGEVVSGARVPDACCGWLVGPDGIAYGVASGEISQIEAVDLSGMRARWPVSIDGIASGPAYGPDGGIVVAVGSPTRITSQVLVFDRDRDAARDASAAIPIVTVDESWGDTGGCPPSPQPPLVAKDGTILVYSEAELGVIALDPSLEVIRGWPYRPATPLVQRDERYVKEDAYCPSLAFPAVGPDSTLYLPLQARIATVGGGLVAVGLDGKVRNGWPVELKRAGSEFWFVVVGSDGTAYALAIEPEGTSTSSASILAIAPDSTVRWTTTVIEP